MRKILIGALVGGVILFIWQSISWMVLDLHAKANQYTPQQTEIMDLLNKQLTADGEYFLPNHPPDATMDEAMAAMDAMEGKPWAKISYHKSMDANMTMNMIRGLIVNIIAVALLCWILVRINVPAFSTVLLASLFTGLIVFLNAPYTQYIWYESFDIWAHFADAVMEWGLVGLWLGYYLRRGSVERNKV
jgi:hypothetical protein